MKMMEKSRLVHGYFRSYRQLEKRSNRRVICKNDPYIQDLLLAHLRLWCDPDRSQEECLMIYGFSMRPVGDRTAVLVDAHSKSRICLKTVSRSPRKKYLGTAES